MLKNEMFKPGIDDNYDFIEERFIRKTDVKHNKFPSETEGKDGDQMIVKADGSIYLCIRASGKWYKFEGSVVHG